MASKVRAIPVYTAKDYPRIRQLPGADNMPATWEEFADTPLRGSLPRA